MKPITDDAERRKWLDEQMARKRTSMINANHSIDYHTFDGMLKELEEVRDTFFGPDGSYELLEVER